MQNRTLSLCILALCSFVNGQIAQRRSSIVVAKESAAKGDFNVELFRLSLEYLQQELGQTKAEPPSVLVLRLAHQTESHYGLALDDAARDALIDRVIRKLNTTVSISALQHH